MHSFPIMHFLFLTFSLTVWLILELPRMLYIAKARAKVFPNNSFGMGGAWPSEFACDPQFWWENLRSVMLISMTLGEPQRTLQMESSINIRDFFFVALVESHAVKLMNPWKNKFSVASEAWESNYFVIPADGFPLRIAWAPSKHKAKVIISALWLVILITLLMLLWI